MDKKVLFLFDVMIVSRRNLFNSVKLFLKLLIMNFVNVTCGQASGNTELSLRLFLFTSNKHDFAV